MTESPQKPTRTDECPDCHALVGDLDAHIRWHGRIVHDIALAVEKAKGRPATPH